MNDRDRIDTDVNGTDTDRFDEGVARLARDAYHAPPETPRDEMWTVIQAARAASAPGASGASVVSIRRFRPQPWWAGVAAALAIGVILGRGSIGGGPDAVVTAEGDTESVAIVSGAAPEGTPLGTPTGTPAAEAKGSPAAGPAQTPGGTPGSTSGGAANVVPRSYRVAAARHLDRSEDFLTMFRVDARSDDLPEIDLEPWARRLLTDTRLLLDSPAGADAELRMLLGDLELVLAQIVQLRAGDEEDLEMIDEGLESSQLLFRLKAAQATAPATVRL